ncbi:hypothetical protein [Pseudoalteromonas sp. Hal056]|uniref:hypothetical protein n=1 Tax=Pseudoalteromonas sp. Hal056 TaxID=3035159 RepID=UPI003FA697D4
MTEQTIIRILKTFIILGICLIILGHSLLAGNYLGDSMGVHGIMISAAVHCCWCAVLFAHQNLSHYFTDENGKRSHSTK